MSSFLFEPFIGLRMETERDREEEEQRVVGGGTGVQCRHFETETDGDSVRDS